MEMRKALSFQTFVLAAPGLLSGAAISGRRSAFQSREQKDYERSFALLRKLTELGQVDLFAS
jgi:hypothetical protein